MGGDYVNDSVTDQLVYDGSYHYTYDGNGNETGRELDSNGDEGSDGSLWRYEYDDLDRLVRVKFYGLASAEAAGQSPRWEIEYRYDWAGRLIERRFSGHTNIETFRVERYVYEGDNVVLMMDENNEVVASFHHAAGTVDRPVYMEAQGQRYYYHYDERGSVIYLTNSQGQIVQRFWYDSFGKLTLDVGMLMPGRLVHTYTGRMWDAYAEVYHYRARVYDPKTGRFLQHDPVFSANPYAYVSNDPVNNVDPYGLVGIPLDSESASDVGEGLLDAITSTYDKIKKKVNDWLNRDEDKETGDTTQTKKEPGETSKDKNDKPSGYTSNQEDNSSPSGNVSSSGGTPNGGTPTAAGGAVEDKCKDTNCNSPFLIGSGGKNEPPFRGSDSKHDHDRKGEFANKDVRGYGHKIKVGNRDYTPEKKKEVKEEWESNGKPKKDKNQRRKPKGKTTITWVCSGSDCYVDERAGSPEPGEVYYPYDSRFPTLPPIYYPVTIQGTGVPVVPSLAPTPTLTPSLVY